MEKVDLYLTQKVAQCSPQGLEAGVWGFFFAAEGFKSMAARS